VAAARERGKAAAAEAGAALVRAGQRVALGSGSTTDLAIRALARRRETLAGLEFVGSSRATEQLAQELGLAIRPLRGDDRFDLMVDGADEVDASFALTKGGGGALFREKLLARLAGELVILVDRAKLVERLGVAFPIPVEAVPYAVPTLTHRLEADGVGVARRTAPDGSPYVTDNANAILDLRFPGGVADPAGTEAALRGLPGVVEVGLFVGLADRVLVGGDDGAVEERRAPVRAVRR
jgi:ribose 5-phosphate isomerase A